jgi:hypothetical protein
MLKMEGGGCGALRSPFFYRSSEVEEIDQSGSGSLPSHHLQIALAWLQDAISAT